MGESKDTHVKVCLKWIWMLSLSPIALLLFMLMGLFLLLQFLCKVALLFTVVVINTPFLVMYNLSVLVFQYNRTRFQIYYRPDHYKNSKPTHWNYSDPRASLGVEFKILVSDFLKVVGGELLLTVTTGIITYYTAPILAFYITLIVGLIVMFHNWLNSDCVSKTALSCLCDGYGLSPLMFLFSFIGLFDIGCHPVAKCSFAASLAYLFVKDEPNTYFVADRSDDLTYGINPNEQTVLSEEVPIERNAELNKNDVPPKGVLKPSARLFELTKKVDEIANESKTEEDHTNLNENDGPKGVPKPSSRLFEVTRKLDQIAKESNTEEDGTELNENDGPKGVLESTNYLFEVTRELDQIAKESNTEKDRTKLNENDGPKGVLKPTTRLFEVSRELDQIAGVDHIDRGRPEVDLEQGVKEFTYGHPFQKAEIDPKQPFIEFLNWNAFERGLFQLHPRIDFIVRNHEGKYRYILKSFMVLKLLGVKLCKYPVERVEIPENYSKGNELFNFFRLLSRNNGFVTDKMRGRYEHSLTLLEIAEGVEESDGYKIVIPVDERFVVAI